MDSRSGLVLMHLKSNEPPTMVGLAQTQEP